MKNISLWMWRVESRERQDFGDFGTSNFLTSHSFRIPVLRKWWYHAYPTCTAIMRTFLIMRTFPQSHSNRHFSASYMELQQKCKYVGPQSGYKTWHVHTARYVCSTYKLCGWRSTNMARQILLSLIIFSLHF